MLVLVVCVFDYGKCVLFCFLKIVGDVCYILGDFLVECSCQCDLYVGEVVFEKDCQCFSYVLLVIVVVVSSWLDLKVFEQEQLMIVGCVCFVLLQVVQVLGFGVQWLIVWMVFDLVVQVYLGLVDGECIVGFIYIGMFKVDVFECECFDLVILLWDWMLLV